MSPQKKTQSNSSESNGSNNLPVPVPVDASNAQHNQPTFSDNQPGSSVPVPVGIISSVPDTDEDIVMNEREQTLPKTKIEKDKLGETSVKPDKPKSTSNSPGSTPSSETKKVLTPSTYVADRVLTPENTGSLLRARLEAAALEFAKAVNTTPEEKARLIKKQQDALAEYTLFVETQKILEKSAAKENNHRLDNLVPKNMPILQIKGGPIRDNARPIHDSLESFISAFERQLKSHNLPLDNHWERLFWLCLNDNQIPWFRRELVDKNRTWADACIEVRKEYGNPFHVFLKRHELFAARPKSHESIRLYTERYLLLAQEAGRTNGIDLTFDFVSSLSSNVREKIYPVLARNYGTNWPTDIMEVSQLVISTLGENIDTNHTGGNNKRHLPVNEPAPSSKTKRKYGNCPVHPKGSHSASECEVLKKQRIHVKENSNNNNSTPAKLCRYCNKVPYQPGHRCQEYFDSKNNNNNNNQRTYHNRSLRVINGSTPSSSSTSSSSSQESHTRVTSKRDNDILNEILLPSQMDEMDITGKYKNNNFYTINTINTLQKQSTESLLLPLTLQTNKQVLGILDTGANKSFITPTLLKELEELDSNFVINKKEVKNIIVSLAEKNSTANILGLVENVKIFYNGKHVVHSFLVMELAGNTPVTVGLDLMTKLGISINGLTASWEEQPQNKEEKVDDSVEPNNSPFGSNTERENFFAVVQPSIEANKTIPKNSFCTVPESVIHLNMPEGAVAHRRQYPLPIAYKELIDKQIKEWLDDGVIEPAPPNTAFNSPLTVTGKKNSVDGSYTKKRICIDPRHINRLLIQTETDRFTLPLIKDIFHLLQGSVVFTTLDLKQAFHRFEIYKPHRNRTAFQPDGHHTQYQFRGAPFGLRPISSVYQRTMTIIFKNMPFVTNFIDDIIIFSPDLETHATHVKAAIDKLTEVQLILNPDKSCFAQHCVYLLGFCVSAKGITLDKRKVSNIQSFPTPTTGHCIQRFAGTINYFRDALPNVVKLLAPLDRLRNTGSLEGLWGSVEQKCFDTLKKLLTEAPILCYPDLTHPFFVATDASQVGIGCTLYQVINKETKHIAFMARALSKSERNYSTTKRELLAIVYALTKFHKFLWGRKFTLFCDHRSLVYLHTQKVANAMMINWLDTILNYDFNIIHLPGMDNILPDRLSRLFPTEKELAGGNALQTINKHNMITYKHHKNNKNKNKSKKSNKRNYTNNNNNIIKHNAITVNTEETITDEAFDIGDTFFVPPAKDRHQLLAQVHAFGHFGAEAMVMSLQRDNLKWPNMHKQAAHFVKSCKTCAQWNITKTGYHPLRSFYAYYPGDQWSIDLASGFGTSNRGNNYLLVMVDLTSRFCVLHALPDKKSDTVVQAVLNTFCDYGFPRYLNSDNGAEFVNDLMKKLNESAFCQHLRSTPWHPQGNSVCERYVQTTINVIRKYIQGATKDWDLFVKPAQLAINNKYAKRLGTTPFAIMYNRTMNGFRDYSKEKLPRSLTEKELQERIKVMTDTVFPALSERAKALIELKQGQFNNKFRLIDYPTGSQVMVKDVSRTNKMQPYYEGPYTIVRKTQGGSYVLRDEQGLLTDRNYAPNQLKLLSHDELVDTTETFKKNDTFYTVQSIVDHKQLSPGKYEYRVRWKGYTINDDTWEPAESFNSPQPIMKYWERIGSTHTNNNTTSSSLKIIPTQTANKAQRRNYNKNHGTKNNSYKNISNSRNNNKRRRVTIPSSSLRRSKRLRTLQ